MITHAATAVVSSITGFIFGAALEARDQKYQHRMTLDKRKLQLSIYKDAMQQLIDLTADEKWSESSDQLREHVLKQITRYNDLISGLEAEIVADAKVA